MTIPRYRNPDYSLRQLQYAVAVADTGGFGRAAEACGVAQPSLSAQVAKLESVLGVQLFERHARGVFVTESGHRLLAAMREVLAASRGVDELGAALARPHLVTLRVAVIPTVAPYLLPAVVERLAARSDAARVHWLELQTDAAERALGEGEVDAVVIADPPTLPSVHDELIGWERFLVGVPVHHPLHGEVTLDQLAEHEVLLLDDGHCLRDHTLDLCFKPGAKESPYRATSLPTLVQMVAAGLGVSVLPAMAVPVEVGRARLRALPFATRVGRTLRLAWRSRSPHAERLVELAAALREAMEVAVSEPLQQRRTGGETPTSG